MSKATVTIDKLFKQIFEDNVFSRSERRALAKLIQEEELTESELVTLRNKTYKYALEELEEDDEDAKQVFKWLKSVNKMLLPKSEIYFSPGEDCLRTLREFLMEVKDSLDVCVFTISDNRLSKEILAAHERGVKVRVISDNSQCFSMGSDVGDLDASGVPTRVDETNHHMHHKFAIFDEEFVVTGSYNWTRRAASHNRENLIITNSRKAVKDFQKEFDRLWKGDTIPYSKMNKNKARGMRTRAITDAFVEDNDSILEDQNTD